MLVKLINRHIKPYWPQLVAIVILQACAQVASLTLPTINANIINDGVVAPVSYTHLTLPTILLV